MDTRSDDYRLGDVAFVFQHRGLLLRRDDGAAMMIGWEPTGWNLIWMAKQPCCSRGTLNRLALDGNRAILSCDACNHTITYYADIGVTEMAHR